MMRDPGYDVKMKKLRDLLKSPRPTIPFAEVMSREKIMEMKGNLRRCGVTSEKFSELDTLHGEWNFQKWESLYQFYMANGNFEKKHQPLGSDSLLEAMEKISKEVER